MPANGQMTPPGGFGSEMKTGVRSMSVQQIPETANGSDESAARWTEEAETAAFGQDMQLSGRAIPSEDADRNLWLLAGCAVVLLAAILFVKFYKVNR